MCSCFWHVMTCFMPSPAITRRRHSVLVMSVSPSVRDHVLSLNTISDILYKPPVEFREIYNLAAVRNNELCGFWDKRPRSQRHCVCSHLFAWTIVTKLTTSCTWHRWHFKVTGSKVTVTEPQTSYELDDSWTAEGVWSKTDILATLRPRTVYVLKVMGTKVKVTETFCGETVVRRRPS